MNAPEPAQSLTVPTDDPAACEAEHRAGGWRLGNLYVGRFEPALADGHQWVCQFWRPAPEKQPELFRNE